MASRPSVLMVALIAPPRYSGAGLQAHRLATRLAERALEVTLLTSTGAPTALRSNAEDGIRVVRWPGCARWPRVDRALFLLAVLMHLLAHPRRYDVVHLHGSFFILRILRPLKRLLGFRVVYKPTTAGRDDAEAIAAVAPRSVAVVDRWIAIASPIAAAAAAAGIAADRVVSVPNGIDLDAFRPRPEERDAVRAELGLASGRPLWLSVGSYVRRKRFHLLVETWARLGPDRPALLLVAPLEGEGQLERDYLATVRTLVERHRLADDVLLVGERADVARLLGAANGFLLTSEREGLPNAVLEAVAAGLPSVVTPLPAADDLVALGDGLVRVVDADPELLAAAVAGCGSVAPGRRPAIAEAGFGAVADRYVRLYSSLAAARLRGATEDAGHE